MSSAAHLRFDVRASSLPEDIKLRLLALADQRLTDEGVLVIKAQTHRSLPRNQADALTRLQALVDGVAQPETPRKATKPSRAAKRRRLDGKSHRGAIKAGRQRVGE